MSKTSSSSSSSGISTLGLLGCIFVTLKLLGYITWSWWWVTAPFWGGLALFLGIVFGGAALAALVYTIAWLVDVVRFRRRR